MNRRRSIWRGTLTAVAAEIAVSDLFALGAAGSVLYGLSLIHQAATWIGAGVGCALVAVELARREAARSKED